MSGHKENRRNLKRIDYKTVNKTGGKVYKNMEPNDKIVLEAKITEDIKEFFFMNDLSGFVTEDEMREALNAATHQSKNYRDVHAELRLSLPDYENQYPNYEDNLSRLREYVKEGKRKVRELREKLEESKKETVRLEKVEKREGRMAELQCEHNFFIAKLDRKMISFDWTLINDCSEISVGIKMLESFLDGWYLLHGKLKGLSGDNHVDKFENSFHDILEYLSEKIDNGKLRRGKYSCCGKVRAD